MVDIKKKNSKNEQESVLEPLTHDFKEARTKKSIRSDILSIAVVVSLLVGIAGGVVGAVYVAPWYADQVKGDQGEKQVVENKKIVLDEESAVVEAVDAVNPSVVSIVVSKDLPKLEQFGSPFDSFFFSIPSGETERQQVGAGSGFIISEDGWIITNRHVVDDPSAEYTVITKDGERYDAQVLAVDPFNDLAIVDIEAVDLPVVTLGDSSSLKLGQRVIAIGNALGEFENTVTTGVVSGTGRNVVASGGAQTEKLSEVIQTDAAINPGNSGGPLLNLAGEVIGVNTAVTQGAQLIGFAIPVNQVKKVVSDVEQFGKVRRPFLGIRYIIVTPQVAAENNLSTDHGALVIQGDTVNDVAVIPGSPAAQAGLSRGDIVLAIDGEEITIENRLADILRKYEPSDTVVLTVLRNDEEINISVTLGEAE